MKRLILVVLAALAFAPAAGAHPLGNFTINHFSRVEVAGHRVYVRYVVDMAEIPTLQRVPLSTAGLALRLDDVPARLRVVRTALAHPKGAAGLRTTRFQAILAGPKLTRQTRVDYRDSSYPGRIGWKEVVVGAHTTSRSDELRAYPKGLLSSPLDVRTATATLAPTTDATPTLLADKELRAPDRVADSGFTTLIERGHLSFLVILGSLAVALFWGAAHALSPGHGKTIVTAYLVGNRGTPRHAALLGLVTTITHTIGVFGLGGVTLALSAFIVPDRIYPWINVLSGALVVIVGIAVLTGRWRTAHKHTHDHPHDHRHDHADGHEHGDGPVLGRVRLTKGGLSHGHHHHDHHEPPKSVRGLVAVGISGGLLPCPSALVVLLAAISLHRVAFGMLLIVAFSFGLALTITGIGLIAVFAKRAFWRMSLTGGVIRFLPAFSALVIVLTGIVMTARAIPELHL
jgi:ABC-type nickel/cobalt efflux system permease component RcnA